VPISWGRKFRFRDITGLDQEIDRLYWILTKMWTEKKSASEIGDRGNPKTKTLDQITTGNLQLKSLQVGEGKDCRAVEKIETFVVPFTETVIQEWGHADQPQALNMTDSDFPQLAKVRRGALWSVYLDPPSGSLEDIIVTSRLVHADSGDNNGTLKVELYNTTGADITLGAGNAYFTILTPREF